MESINREMQDRVWRRVRGETPEPPQTNEEGPEGLLLAELTDGRMLRQLGSSDALQQLEKQTAERAEILRGLCILMQVTPPQISKNAERPGPGAPRRLMGNLLRRHREYCRLNDHPEYGPIYGHLAQSAQDSCALLAKYIGMTPLRNRKK